MSSQTLTNSPVALMDLLLDMGVSAVPQGVTITGVATDSRVLQAGYLFLALPGLSHHGLDFLPQAIEAGIAAICYESHDPRFDDAMQTRVSAADLVAIPIKNIVQQTGVIAARFYREPSASQWVIGVTGTDGKTSVTQIIAQALDSEKTPCGVIGTLGNGPVNQLETTGMTTPDAVSLQQTFAHFSEQGIDCVAMEVSSHALAQSRINGVDFDIAVLTNIGRDHLDYHGDLKTYRATKLSFFQRAELKHIVVNLDDSAGREIYKLKHDGVQIHGYSQTVTSQDSNVIKARNISTAETGLSLTVDTPTGSYQLHSKLMGRFNVSNLLAAFCTLRAMGFDCNDIAARLGRVEPIPGRMELFNKPGCPSILVDYAHTPQALEIVLLSAREHCQEKLWCVFGCGGDRDTGKRPLMAAVAEQNADQIIITDDNPRNESGDAIVGDIVSGLHKPSSVFIERNRGAAITHAFKQASVKDLILVAGKGHEEYQQIGDKKLSFSDRHYAQQLLREAG